MIWPASNLDHETIMNLRISLAVSISLLLAGITTAQTHTVEVIPAGAWTFVFAINDNGTAAGSNGGRIPWIYRTTDTSVQFGPQGSDNETYIHGINNNGVVVGTVRPNNLQTFTWAIGQSSLTYLPSIGGNSPVGRSINDSGLVTGNFGGGLAWFLNFLPSNSSGGFVWSPLTGHTVLPSSGTTNNVPMHIANNGTVTGYRNSNAFTWTPGSPNLSLFSAPAFGDATVYGMNSSRVMVGGIGNRATRFAPGDPEFTFLTGAGINSHASAISNNGTVVGRYHNGSNRPCFWLPNTTTPIELPMPIGGTSGEAVAINSNGWIVGNVVISNASHPVIWKALPTDFAFAFSTKDGDGSANRPNTPYQILNSSLAVVASGTTNGSGMANVTLPFGSYTLSASQHGVFVPTSALASTSAVTVSQGAVSGDLNLELGTLEAYFTVGGRIHRGTGTISIGGVSKDLNRSRAGNWFSDGGNAKACSATVTINGQTRVIPGTLIPGRDHTTLSFEWNNGS